MIFISTACVTGKTIKERVQKLADVGIKQIELSGGTQFYPTWEDDVMRLAEEYELKYLCHNYFPPPEIDFVFNLASTDASIQQRSFDLANQAIAFCQRQGISKFGLHAGFYFDIPVEHIGHELQFQPLIDRQVAESRFFEKFTQLRLQAHGVELFIENNVLSTHNLQAFNAQVPFMLVQSSDWFELRSHLECRLLLDVAHLKVTCHSLGLDFKSELTKLMPETIYVHLSDTHETSDDNDLIRFDGQMWLLLREFDMSGKTITLETKAEPAQLRTQYDQLTKALHET